MEINFFLSLLLFDDSGSEGPAAGFMGKQDDRESGERLWLSHRILGQSWCASARLVSPAFIGECGTEQHPRGSGQEQDFSEF